MSEKEVSIYTDGACLGNPGRGGYGVVLCYNGNQKQLSGGFSLTTNNRMEIMAAIVGLEALKSPCTVNLYTDSKYLADAMTKRWAQRWKRNGWRRNKKEKAVNPDLWSKLLKLCEQHSVRFRWIKGHAGHEWNEICDKLSKQAAEANNLPEDDGFTEVETRVLHKERRAMLMFDLLRTMNPNLNPEDAKLHLAAWNGLEQPIDVYLAGNFNDWQSWQSKKNFERKFVVSLINLPHQKYKWLFAGVYQSAGVERKWSEEHQMHHYWYELTEHEDYKEMNGRMVVTFIKPSRGSYLYAEKWSNRIFLSEIYAEKQSIGEFPGFKAVNLTKAQLELIVQKSPESWRTALSNVAGVYLISDIVTGRFYVGSAYGEGGIWHRWSEYANNGHGGNVELKGLLADEGTKYAENFRYSILEISDLHDSHDNILQRESHWKDILMSRIYGLNAN